MPSSADIEEYSATTQAVVALAVTQLATYMASGPAPGELGEVYAELVATFGRATASIAADWYDDLRDKSTARRGFTAAAAEPIPREQALAVVEWASRPRPALWTPPDTEQHEIGSRAEPSDSQLIDVNDEYAVGEGSLPESDPDEAADPGVETVEQIAARLERSLQRLIMQPARDTVVESAERDPAGARWARVPTGTGTCAFCLVMASRGALYTSRAAASQVVGRRGRPRGSRGLGDRYHDDCNCVATPLWPGSDYPDGYDPDALYQQYRDAADAVRSGDLKTILAELRRQHGIR